MAPKYDEAVYMYQCYGDSNLLLLLYRPYIDQYFNLLTKGIIDFRNKDLLSFIRCFFSDTETKQAIDSGRLNTNIKKQLMQKTEEIMQAVNDLDEEDIWHELFLLLLVCAKKYVNKGASFHHYIKKCYIFDLYRFIVQKLKTIKNISSISYYDFKQDSYQWLSKENEQDLDDPMWLEGTKSGRYFKDLSYSERYTLVQFYMHKKTDKEIAKQLNMHPQTIYKIRKRAKEKLERGLTSCAMKLS